MPTYRAYFYTDGDFATRRFEVDTPEQALALARQFYDDDPLELTFESYEGGLPVNEIVIMMPITKSLRCGAPTPGACSWPRVTCSMP